MYVRRCAIAFLAGWLLLTLIFVGPRPAEAQATSPSAVAALLMIDVSGSNRQTDPGNLRFTDARLFASLLDEGDALGLIAFSSQSRRLTDGMVSIHGAADKRTLVQRLQAVPADGYTDFKAAFADARAMLKSTDLGGRKAVVICLTDGQPEIAAPYPAYEDEALAEARGLGVPVLSIALTQAAMTPFLSQVARETGGAVIPASLADDLLDAYLAVFSQIKDRTVVGSRAQTAPGTAQLPLDPALMPYVEKASFVISKPASVQAKLVGPDGLPAQPGMGGVSYLMSDDPLFTVVTVDQPAGGSWGFQLAGSGAVQARAIIRSRLRLEMATPGMVHEASQPMPVTVRLVEEKADGRIVKIIGEASFSALITRPDGRQESLDQFYDDGTHGDVRAGDGDFTRLYVNADRPGTYTITVRGNKGQVPVERTVRVEALMFPAIQPEDLSGAHFEVRGEPVTVAARLNGGTQVQFDGGNLVARITPPSGSATELTLRWDGKRYSAEYLPQQDGAYQVEFLPRGATYLGLPYQHTAKTQFAARIVPMLTIDARRLDIGQVELAEAKQGLALTLPITSTSRKIESLAATVSGMLGWSIVESQPMPVPAGATAGMMIHLKANEQVAPGPVTGQITLTGPQGVDLLGDVVPVKGELYQPSIRVAPVPLDLGSPATCFGWNAALKLAVESTGRQAEEVSLGLDGTTGLKIEPATVKVQPGKSEVMLKVNTAGELQPGSYAATLRLSGRPGLVLAPGSVPVNFRIAPVTERCRGPLTGGGVLAIGLLAGTVVTVRRIRRATKPPEVRGTLRHWPIGRPDDAVECDLTARHRNQIVLGRGGQCDLVIADQALADQHAVIQAERTDEGVRVMLRPIGEVKRGYRTVAEPFTLNHRDTFRMGGREYQYLGDEVA